MKVSTEFETSSEFEQDEVIRTNPAAGTMAKKGTAVTLIISSGEDETRRFQIFLERRKEKQGKYRWSGNPLYNRRSVLVKSYGKGKVCYQSEKRQVLGLKVVLRFHFRLAKARNQRKKQPYHL